jgi:hypothetical protein
MSQWWTYSLSDFLMFSARTYFRQFELLNRAVWPLHLVALIAGMLLIHGMLRPRKRASVIAFGVLAISWAWVAWAYHAGRYADINTGAPYFAAAFGVQALLLAWMMLRKQPAAQGGIARRAPVAIMVLALFAYPLLAPLNGRSLWQAEVFAIAPDPTVAATFAALLCWRAPWALWIVPLLWSAASGATLKELHAPQAWLLPAVAILAAALATVAARKKLSC